MGTTAQKLQAIANSKSAIKAAIEAKGVSDVGDVLSDYATKIASIPSGGGGSTKFGMTIDSVVGDVNSSGQLQPPSTPFSFSSTEITSLAGYTLYYKFCNNTGLTSVNLPNLTSCGTNCLQNAFYGCTNLTSVNLPKLASGTLQYTFRGCTSLTSVELPEFNGNMTYAFQQCTNLVSFSATNWLTGNFSSPFSGCTNLESINLINFNGTSLSFSNLSKLKTVKICSFGGSLNGAFNGCTSLELIDLTDCPNVPTANSHSFTNLNASCKVLVPNRLYKDFISSTWTLVDGKIKRAFYQICFTAKQANSTVAIQKVGNAPAISLEYHTTSGHWTPYTIGDVITLSSIGDWVYFRATENGNSSFSTDSQNYNHFVVTGQVQVDDSPFYLLNSEGTIPNQMSSGCFQGLFKDCSALSGWINLLSITDVGVEREFANAFENSAITKVEASNMTTAGESQFFEAFKGNTSIQVVNFPYLSSCTGASSLEGAFKNCTSLTEVRLPRLSSTTSTSLNDAFNGCTSLQIVDFSLATSVPQITSTTFANTNSSFEVRVPQALYNDWIAAPNWSNYSSQIVGVSVQPYTGVKLTSKQANSTLYFCHNEESGSDLPHVSVDYSLDGGQSWITWTQGWRERQDRCPIRALNIGDTICLKATTTNNSFSGFAAASNTIKGTGKFDLSGILESLLDAQNYETMTSISNKNALSSVFAGNTALVDASQLKSIATTVSERCYGYIFSGCSNLEKGPEFFAQTLNAFSFSTAFLGCSKLNELKIHYTGDFNVSGDPFQIWVDGVKTTSGTFYYNGSDTTSGISAIPTGWTITPFAT